MNEQAHTAPAGARQGTGDFGTSLAQASILVVDDEPGMRNFLLKVLAPRCRQVEAAPDCTAAAALLDRHHFDIVILDNVMPGKNGLEWLREQRAIGFFADAILITAFADLETAIEALRAGAVDFVLKPFRSNQILNAVARSLDRQQLRRENFLLRHELATDQAAGRTGLVGCSMRLEDIRATLKKVAPLPTPVLFTGDTGTGKEVAARTLHAMSDRADRPFVAVNCATTSPDIIAAELFGDVSGHAEAPEGRRDGLLLHASGATIFLDEIADLPLPVQGMLLRVIDEMRLRPFGSEREVPLNLRFIFATNKDLAAAVEAGSFRADLYHRINVLNIHMPPLSEHPEDIPELASLFMSQISHQLGRPPLALGEDVLLNLATYDWPGNVRELRNLIERSLILGEFPPEFAGGAADYCPENPDTLACVERRHILRILEACGGNRAEAARRLGVSRKTIDRKCAMWNV